MKEFLLVCKDAPLEKQVWVNPWLKSKKLVVKPDQLMGKRGKNNLLLLDADYDKALEFINANLGKTVQVGKVSGELTHFLVEPFVTHEVEYFVALKTSRDFDELIISQKGGVDVEENWGETVSLRVPVLSREIPKNDFEKALEKFPVEHRKLVSEFIHKLYSFFVGNGFSYLELNPFTVVDGKIVVLASVARVDDTSLFEHAGRWGDLEFPTPFGRRLTHEEHFVKELDEKTGASVKLTVLNPDGSIWPLVAGGGASVIYADTVADLGKAGALAIYGEYSGDPDEETTYQYTKTILGLLGKSKAAKKVLLVGGGIANFTDVAKTFKGIIRALKEGKSNLAGTKIFVRRGGPNYKEGLANMKKLSGDGLDVEVYGPETHMTKIVSKAIAWLGE